MFLPFHLQGRIVTQDKLYDLSCLWSNFCQFVLIVLSLVTLLSQKWGFLAYWLRFGRVGTRATTQHRCHKCRSPRATSLLVAFLLLCFALAGLTSRSRFFGRSLFFGRSQISFSFEHGNLLRLCVDIKRECVNIHTRERPEDTQRADARS